MRRLRLSRRPSGNLVFGRDRSRAGRFASLWLGVGQQTGTHLASPEVVTKTGWMPPKAARTEGPPERGQAVESIARSAPLGLSAPLPPHWGITSTDGSTIEATGTHPVCVGST